MSVSPELTYRRLCALHCPVGTITPEVFHLLPSEPTGLTPLQAVDGSRPPQLG